MSFVSESPSESYGTFKKDVVEEEFYTISEQLLVKEARTPLQRGVDALDFVLYPKGSSLINEARSNIVSGITVGMVSVPLALSLATASGATPLHGIVSAFWAGLVSGICGGSHYNIVGPTGSLSGLLNDYANRMGTPYLSVISFFSGIMILLVWVFKLTRYFLLIPTGVVEGFTMGVAVIIAVNQMNSALGLTNLPVHGSFISNTLESLYHLPETNTVALSFFLFHFIALILLIKKWPGVPWSIFIAWEGVAIGLLCNLGTIPIHLTTLKDRYGSIPAAVYIHVNLEKNMISESLLPSAFGCAFIAVIESLISARIADRMTRTHHNQEREILGLGLSNVISGLVGGIPCTAALARTALNVKSGATSRISAIICSFCILILGTAAAPLFQYLPMPTIAALLVTVAIRMVETEKFVHLYHYDRSGFLICLISAGVCIIVDTVAGLLVGALISLLIFADHTSKGYSDALIRSTRSVAKRLQVDKLAKKLEKKQYIMQIKERANRMKSLRKLSHNPESTSLFASMDLASKQTNKDTTDIDDNQRTYSSAGDLVLPSTPFQHPKSRSYPTSPDCVPEDYHQDDEEQVTIEKEMNNCNSNNQLLVYRISGQLNFMNAKNHLEKVRVLADPEIIETKYVCIALRHLYYIDFDGVDALGQFIDIFTSSGKTVFISGAIHGNVKKMLKNHDFYRERVKNGHVFDNYKFAMEYCSQITEQTQHDWTINMHIHGD